MLIRRLLPVNPRSSKVARDCLDAVGQVLSPTRMDDLRVIASELVTSCLLHAAPGEAPGIGFTVEVAHGTVRLEVTERGPGFTRSPPHDDEDRASGWGLLLVERLADRWGVDPAGTMWAEVLVGPRGSNARAVPSSRAGGAGAPGESRRSGAPL